MVGQHGILRQPGGQEEGIHGIGFGGSPGRNDGVKAATHSEQPTRLYVIEQEGLLRPHVTRTFGGKEGSKLTTSKDRMSVEKMFEFHLIAF